MAKADDGDTGAEPNGRVQEFAAALRAARERHEPRMTQGTLAKELGVAQASVSWWEQGRNEPDRDTVFALEKVLGLAPGTLSRKLGYLPLEWDAERERMSFEEFVEIDVDNLSPAERNALITLYRTFTER